MNKMVVVAIIFMFTNLYSEIKVYKYTGDVKFLDSNESVVFLKEGDVLKEGYSVITSPKSEVQLIYDNKSMVFLFENSRFTVGVSTKSQNKTSFWDLILPGKKLYAEDKSWYEEWYDYLYGKATFFINKLDKKYSVKIPQAVCGVRGTNFTIISSTDVSEVGLFNGIVDIEKDGKIHILKPNQSAYITQTDIKIQQRLSKIMEAEKKRAEKLKKYFDNVRNKLEYRDKRIKEKLGKE